MKIEDQVKQLTELVADLIPAVDRLTQRQDRCDKVLISLTDVVEKLTDSQERNDDAVQRVVDSVGKINATVSEIMISTMQVTELIEKVVVKNDKMDYFEERLIKLEGTVLKKL